MSCLSNANGNIVLRCIKVSSSDSQEKSTAESFLEPVETQNEQRIEKLENENALLKSEVEELKMINSKVENDYNKSEYELKKKSLILFGLPEVNKEECSELIIDMAVNKIGINIKKITLTVVIESENK
ncbi:hypothetical protein JTB14_020697 [Gonioctena quinquepunctata]|nr:hypothetical protein JTB14_020697 [Gonioctena quinquepunctata]